MKEYEYKELNELMNKLDNGVQCGLYPLTSEESDRYNILIEKQETEREDNDNPGRAREQEDYTNGAFDRYK